MCRGTSNKNGSYVTSQCSLVREDVLVKFQVTRSLLAHTKALVRSQQHIPTLKGL